jgi:NADPH2:quinone reductase
MKAAYIEQTGAPEVIQYGDLPQPVPKQGEVLVRVGAVSLNPVDTYIRSGMVAMQLPKPYVVGCDLAGTIEAVGPGAERFQPGDRVWGTNQGLLGRQGTFAEYASVNEDWLYPTPENVSDETAAAVSLVGNTAHLGLFRSARLQAGETVFVNGGTGGVGHMVVQMSKAAGARVITTVGTNQKAETCRAWGADLVINYKTQDVDEEIRNFVGERGVQVWYETLREPDFERTVPLLGMRGRMVLMAGRDAKPVFPVGPFYVKDLSLFGIAMFNASPEEQRACADDINRWLVEGKLKPLVGKRFSLSETAAAQQLQQDNTIQKAGTLTGKIVLAP